MVRMHLILQVGAIITQKTIAISMVAYTLGLLQWIVPGLFLRKMAL